MKRTGPHIEEDRRDPNHGAKSQARIKPWRQSSGETQPIVPNLLQDLFVSIEALLDFLGKPLTCGEA